MSSRKKTQSRAEQLADAYEAIARINHYMVGITARVTTEERDEAQAILVGRINAISSSEKPGIIYNRLQLAYDILLQDKRRDAA